MLQGSGSGYSQLFKAIKKEKPLGCSHWFAAYWKWMPTFTVSRKFFLLRTPVTATRLDQTR